MADGAAHDAAEHVRAAHAVREDALRDQERGGARVVRDDTHGDVVIRLRRAVALAADHGGEVHDGTQEVCVVVAEHVLRDHAHTLESGASVDAGRGERHQAAVRLPIELHEHEVPQLEPAAAVGRGLLTELARVHLVDTQAVVQLAAGAAWTGVAHLPEVVGRAAADDALVREPGNVLPDRCGLVVRGRQAFLTAEDGHHDAIGIELQHLGEERPRILDGVALEVVAEREVAEHLEEGVVTRGHAHVLEVVVLAADADALLRRRGALVRADVLAREHVLERHHARVGEHQRGVVGRHQRARGHALVAALGEEVQEGVADLFRSLWHGGVVFHSSLWRESAGRQGCGIDRRARGRGRPGHGRAGAPCRYPPESGTAR